LIERAVGTARYSKQVDICRRRAGQSGFSERDSAARLAHIFSESYVAGRFHSPHFGLELAALLGGHSQQ
jgi:hypothetical protein